MNTVNVTRKALIPDPVRISRYSKAPELGPEILFFSGGSALHELSQHLKNYTHNSIHLVTPFDSGGSSAKLRHAFSMPAIGDLRSRMMALADETITGHPEVYRLFTYRLPAQKSQKALKKQLMDMVDGSEPLIQAIPNPMRRLIRNMLDFFVREVSDEFDLRGASIGNLVIAGGYLNNHRHLDPVIFLFSKLVSVQGTVRAVVNDDLHLSAKLSSGKIVTGQHRMTGKEIEPIYSKIVQLMLSSHPDKYVPAKAILRKKNRKLIKNVDLICFPPGSFYSSLVANLLPEGVADAIVSNANPKVFIPNLGNDPEQFDMTLNESVDVLLHVMKQALTDKSAGVLLDFILYDSKNGSYECLDIESLRKKGIEVIDVPLISAESEPYYDPELLSNALLSLV